MRYALGTSDVDQRSITSCIDSLWTIAPSTERGVRRSHDERDPVAGAFHGCAIQQIALDDLRAQLLQLSNGARSARHHPNLPTGSIPPRDATAIGVR